MTLTKDSAIEAVTCDNIIDNETWSSCPICKEVTKDEKSVPGLLLQVRVCVNCLISPPEKMN